jgi:hypothetical protein
MAKTAAMAAGHGGWAGYRLRKSALAAAAAAAAIDADVEATLENGAWADAFGGRLELARAAQDYWWLGLLGRLDASFDDDLSAVSPADRYTVLVRAWRSHSREASGHWSLAALGDGDSRHAAAGSRYHRVLALFAGRAEAADDCDVACSAGRDLVRELVMYESGV